MTPSDLKSARKALGLSQSGLAEALRMGANGDRTVRGWENGYRMSKGKRCESTISGPAEVAIEYMLREATLKSDIQSD